jgi:hypothetical protein
MATFTVMVPACVHVPDNIRLIPHIPKNIWLAMSFVRFMKKANFLLPAKWGGKKVKQSTYAIFFFLAMLP